MLWRLQFTPPERPCSGRKEETQMQNPKGKPSIVLVVVMGGSTGNKVSSTNSSPEICLWGFNTLFQTGGKM